MYDHRNRPSLRNCLVGGAIGILVFVCISIFLVTAGPDFIIQTILFFPDTLGMVHRVTPENTLLFESSGTYRLPDFGPGDYLIYFSGTQPIPEIKLGSESGSVFPVLLPFPIVDDLQTFSSSLGSIGHEVIYRFRVDASETYLLNIRFYHYGTVEIVPDISKHNDRVLAGALIIQPLLIGLGVFGFYRWRNRDNLAVDKSRKQAEREKFDNWLDSLK